MGKAAELLGVLEKLKEMQTVLLTSKDVEKLKDSDTHLYQSKAHMGNFVDCIKSRKQPISPIETAVQSDLISHLSNAAIRLKRPIKWDPRKEKIIGDSEAAKMLSRPMRRQ